MKRPDPAEIARRLNLSYTRKGDKDLAQAYCDLPGIPAIGAVTNVMEGDWHGRRLRIFQHAYQIHTGYAPVVISHTVYAVDAPPWPLTVIARRRLLGRLLYRVGRRNGLLLEDPRFNRTFRVKTDDEDFAITLLTPEMQAFLLTKPSAAWQVAPGRVCLVYAGSLRADRVERSLARLRAFLDEVPDELEAW